MKTIGLVLLLMVIFTVVIVPVIDFWTDYNVARVLANEATYQVNRTALLAADAEQGDLAILRRKLESQLESERLKLAFDAGALQKVDPSWKADSDALPRHKLLLLALQYAPEFWISVVERNRQRQ